MNHYENDDRRNDDASFGDQAERFSRKLSDSAQQVWLAGLGALGRAQAEGRAWAWRTSMVDMQAPGAGRG